MTYKKVENYKILIFFSIIYVGGGLLLVVVGLGVL